MKTIYQPYIDLTAQTKNRLERNGYIIEFWSRFDPNQMNINGTPTVTLKNIVNIPNTTSNLNNSTQVSRVETIHNIEDGIATASITLFVKNENDFFSSASDQSPDAKQYNNNNSMQQNLPTNKNEDILFSFIISNRKIGLNDTVHVTLIKEVSGLNSNSEIQSKKVFRGFIKNIRRRSATAGFYIDIVCQDFSKFFQELGWNVGISYPFLGLGLSFLNGFYIMKEIVNYQNFVNAKAPISLLGFNITSSNNFLSNFTNNFTGVGIANYMGVSLFSFPSNILNTNNVMDPKTMLGQALTVEKEKVLGALETIYGTAVNSPNSQNLDQVFLSESSTQAKAAGLLKEFYDISKEDIAVITEFENIFSNNPALLNSYFFDILNDIYWKNFEPRNEILWSLATRIASWSMREVFFEVDPHYSLNSSIYSDKNKSGQPFEPSHGLLHYRIKRWILPPTPDNYIHENELISDNLNESSKDIYTAGYMFGNLTSKNLNQVLQIYSASSLKNALLYNVEIEDKRIIERFGFRFYNKSDEKGGLISALKLNVLAKIDQSLRNIMRGTIRITGRPQFNQAGFTVRIAPNFIKKDYYVLQVRHAWSINDGYITELELAYGRHQGNYPISNMTIGANNNFPLATNENLQKNLNIIKKSSNIKNCEIYDIQTGGSSNSHYEINLCWLAYAIIMAVTECCRNGGALNTSNIYWQQSSTQPCICSISSSQQIVGVNFNNTNNYIYQDPTNNTSNYIEFGAVSGGLNTINSYMTTLNSLASTYNIPVTLLCGILGAENSSSNTTISSTHAVGYFQIEPETAAAFVNSCIGNSDSSPSAACITALENPSINLIAGTKFLASLYSEYDGNIDSVIAAYGGFTKNSQTGLYYSDFYEYKAKYTFTNTLCSFSQTSNFSQIDEPNSNIKRYGPFQINPENSSKATFSTSTAQLENFNNNIIYGVNFLKKVLQKTKNFYSYSHTSYNISNRTNLIALSMLLNSIIKFAAYLFIYDYDAENILNSTSLSSNITNTLNNVVRYYSQAKYAKS